MFGEDLSVDDVELKRGRSEWRLVVKTKVKANSIASSINQKLQSAEARVKSPVFIGVIKNIPTTYDADKVKNCVSGCERAEQCGRSRTYKLYFSSRIQLGLAMKSPPKLEFERFRLKNLCTFQNDAITARNSVMFQQRVPLPRFVPVAVS